jgi:allantoicase
MQNSEGREREAGRNHSTPAFTSMADLSSARVGGRPIATNDDFFAPMANLVKAEPAVFIPGKFTARGKWMDGWESRRRRTPGHDWCVVKLGMRGRIRGVDVDTSYFTGNFPSHCSIEALDTTRAVTKQVATVEGGPWSLILARTPLRGDSHNYLEIERTPELADRAWTHVRLNIYPDGGVARLRVHGDVVVDWSRIVRSRKIMDLAEIRNGGLVIAASDMHFGAKDNMIMPGRAKNMGDGWETKRRRGPGYDWAIVRLGTAGLISRIELDTNHFKGNFPDSASIEGCFAPAAPMAALGSADWHELLPQTKLKAHHRHFFTRELQSTRPVTHVRLNIYPDGGVSRLRVYGTVAEA